MARGEHPNSRANLKPLQKGLPEKHQREIQQMGTDAAVKERSARATYFDVAVEDVTKEDILAQIHVLKELALDGDIRAIELLMKILKEWENKISVDAGIVYEIVIDDDDEEETAL